MAKPDPTRKKNPDKPGAKTGWHQSDKQKAKAREVMIRLRRERPDRFTSDARRRKPKPPAPMPAAPPIPEPTPQPTPPPAPALPPSWSWPCEAVEGPQPPAAPNFMTVQPDTELFGTENVPPPKADQTPPPGSQPTPGAPTTGSQPGPTGLHTTVLPADTRALAVLVWTMILNLLAVLFGPAMYPRKKGDGPNEVPYDENEMVIGAWMDYFVSIGLKPLSPVMNLWLAILAYMLPRAQFVVITVKKWFSPKARGQQTERTPSPAETPPPETPPSKEESPSSPPEPSPPEPEQGKLATREEAAAAAADFL
jgi:hypothetical protein